MPLIPDPSNVPGMVAFDPSAGSPKYLQPYPARRTVLSFPNHGSDQLKPTEGAKLFQSSFHICLSGFGEFLPTNCTVVREPQEIPHNPAAPPTGPPARPCSSYGTPKYQ